MYTCLPVCKIANKLNLVHQLVEYTCKYTCVCSYLKNNIAQGRCLYSHIKLKISLKHILILGIITRVMFLVFGAPIYYGRTPFYMHDDSIGWMDSIVNLINTGTYTANAAWANGVFYRPPGYSFFLGFCYLITGMSVERGFLCAVILQSALDILNIFFCYKIVFQLTQNKNTSLAGAFIYALYPFTLVWDGAATAEILSVTLMFASFYFYTNPTQKYRLALSALFLGFASLTRPQCIVLFPCIIAVEFIFNIKNPKKYLKNILQLLLFFSLSYGLWPARNYINQNKLIFIQDANIGNVWSPDWFAFMRYIFAVQTDIEPQASQLMNGEKVTWNAQSYHYSGDSANLASFTNMLDTCGTGVSYFRLHKNLIDTPVASNQNCDAAIAKLSEELVANQKKYNAFNYYINVPFSNLKKSLFKSGLYGKQSNSVKIIASLLFGIRTVGILAGLSCCIWLLLFSGIRKEFLTITIMYFAAWYAYMCWLFRNIEVRYFLNADTLLLIPLAIVIGMLIDKYYLHRKTDVISIADKTS